MTISHEKRKKDIWVVSVSGRLDQTQGPDLEKVLTSLIASSITRMVVDLSETEYINSGGLRILVTAWRLLHQNEGELILVGLNDRLKMVFEMVGFDKVFTIVSAYEDAVARLENRG
jgi:anti-anti-sigma factor